MRKISTSLVPLFLLTFSLISCSNCTPGDSFRGVDTSTLPVAKKLIKPYLSSVSIENEEGRVFCSGTILRNEENEPMMVLTAYHCVDGNKEGIYVTTGYDSRIREMSIKKGNKDLDLALLVAMSVETKAGPFVFISSDTPKIGEPVWAIGNPSGEERVVTEGTVSKHQTEEIIEKDVVVGELHYYRITCPIYYGNSGGGLFNRFGDLVGVVVSMEMGLGSIYILDPSTQSIFEAPFIMGTYPKPGGFLAVSLEDLVSFL